MKITVKNLGAIKQAEFTLGELTIICGKNNTGKTYATHATYGFLDFLLSSADLPVEDNIVSKLLSEGSATIDLYDYANNLQKHLDGAAQQYSKNLYQVFAGNENQFKISAFHLNLESEIQIKINNILMRMGSAERSVLQINSMPDNKTLEISLIVDNTSDDIPPRNIIKDMIIEGVRSSLLKNIIPRPFIASAERTGAAIFQKELDFTRNRIIEFIGTKSSELNPIRFLDKFIGEYPLAIRKNVDFIRSLSNIKNREGFIIKHYPEVLDSFSDIIGGEYKINKDDEVQFLPSQDKNKKLSMVESSSAVRSLLDIGFYLRHIATPGDLLMVDEPELNLHPENQRKVARLFARLVNIGIKVFITTHSDYIIKELNTLIMLNQDGEDGKRLKVLAEKEGYNESELLNPEKIRVYIAKEALVKLDGTQRRTKCHTLVAADIDKHLGIEARSFDETIEDMNRIQEEIVWGGNE